MKSKISIAFDNCQKEKRPALITSTVAGENIKFSLRGRAGSARAHQTYKDQVPL